MVFAVFGAVAGALSILFALTAAKIIFRVTWVQTFNPAFAWGAFLFNVIFDLFYYPLRGLPLASFLGDIGGAALVAFLVAPRIFKRF